MNPKELEKLREKLRKSVGKYICKCKGYDDDCYNTEKVLDVFFSEFQERDKLLVERIEGLKEDYPSNIVHPDYEEYCREWETNNEILSKVQDFINNIEP